MEMTELQRARKLCREWQRILRLQDWDIDVRIVRFHESMDRSLGECAIVGGHKAASIKVRSWIDNGYDGIGPEAIRDPEVTIVHELLHVHVSAFEPEEWDSPEGVAAEQSISQLARAFVDLKRKAVANQIGDCKA